MLGESHRNAQDDLARLLMRLIVAQWRNQVEPGIPSDTMASQWIGTVAPLVLAYRDRSATLAAGFYNAARSIGAPGAPPIGQVAADEVPIESIATSLKVTGIIGVTEKIVAGMDPDIAFRQAGRAAGAAGVRHALNGGRSLTNNAITQDPVALGYYRQTRAECCAFCALLASRGKVYKEASFELSDVQFRGDGTVKVHDDCHCTLVPVYSRDQELPQANEDAFDVYVAARDAFNRGEYKTNLQGADGVRAAFRAAWDARVSSTS